MTLIEADPSPSEAHQSLRPPTFSEREKRPVTVLGVPISSLTMQEAIAQVDGWARTADRTRLVTFTNVHMLVEAQVHPAFQGVMDGMDMNCPDGAPIYWLARRKGEGTEKISGPDFMPLFCEQSVAPGHRHFFYGGGSDVARDTARVLSERYPGLQVAGHLSPPFRDLTQEETESVIHRINASGADVVWVCLGCPRQEAWIHQQRGRLNAKVVLAVGQAFDIIAGRRSRAPALLRRCGLEWLYRLFQEPHRLWKRYLVTNALFTLLLIRDKLQREFA